MSGGFMPGKVRRIVTGLSSAGRSIIASDSYMPAADLQPGDRLRAGMWRTESSPASNDSPDPCPDGVIDHIAPRGRGGSVFRVTDIPPDSAGGNPHDLASRGANTTSD